MTEQQADQLKPGDVVYVNYWFMGSQPYVTSSSYLMGSDVNLKTSRGHSKGYYLEDGNVVSANRMHVTEAEARQYVADFLRARIKQLQETLREWEANMEPSRTSEPSDERSINQ